MQKVIPVTIMTLLGAAFGAMLHPYAVLPLAILGGVSSFYSHR